MPMGLILEGGGTRGAYTAGVLDVLTENEIYIPVTYGVSAGACNALSYLSKQYGRNKKIFTEYASDKRYCSVSNLAKTGSIFGFDFIFGELGKELVPFDRDELMKTTMQIRIGTTDCVSGGSVFFNKSDIGEDYRVVIASSSLPVVGNIIEFNGYHLIDGGVAAPIPIDKAIDDGITKNIIVLTRDKGYIKKDKPDFPVKLLRSRYRDYPGLVEAMIDRAGKYNRERQMCYDEQEKGNAFVIEPSEPITISRYCTDHDRLESIYQLGVKDAKEKLTQLRIWMAWCQHESLPDRCNDNGLSISDN